MSHREICEFTTKWLVENLPDVIEWNYEENVHRSFDVPHVHCFFRYRGDPKPELIPRTPIENPRVSSGDKSELVCNKRSFAVVSDDESDTSRHMKIKGVLIPRALPEVSKNSPNLIERSESSDIEEEKTSGSRKKRRAGGKEVSSVFGLENSTHPLLLGNALTNQQ